MKNWKRLLAPQEAPVLQQMAYPRGLGVLMPIFSLPSPHGVGNFGAAARQFCDFLREAGIRYWQVLPLGPTGYGDSPYQSFSGVAGNPYFIDLEDFCERGWLTRSEVDEVDFGADEARIDYAKLYEGRRPLLWRAFQRARAQGAEVPEAFRSQQASWLEDYALFMAIKEAQNQVAWTQWPAALRDRDPAALAQQRIEHREAIEFQIFLQYHFFAQWKSLRDAARERDLLLVGDLPIYPAHDSVEVWAHRDQFLLDEEGIPTVVAGAPPDAFTALGQRWGNPIYHWARMKEDGYAFWVDRLRAQLKIYDIIRLDHFIGFTNYWAVPASDPTARTGHWEDGPGLSFFRRMEEALGPLPLLIEDLGVLSPRVIQLREQVGFPGMRPLQFAFEGADSDYRPHHFPARCVVYTGTHDTDTLRGWWETLPEASRQLVSDYFGLRGEDDLPWRLVQGAAASVADICIFQMQDLLWLDSRARMNLPGTIGGNWQWRLQKDYPAQRLAQRLRALASLYSRLN